MKVILFIGHFKTGSTSLQRFLSRNFHALLKAGILYPSVESQGIAHNMAALRNGRDFDWISDKLNVTEPHNALALVLKTEEDSHGVPHYYEKVPSGFQMFEMIENQIKALEPKALLICSEVFALFSHTEQQKSIARLANRLAHHDVTIYANLRRPDNYLSSWHRQRLKFGEKIRPLRGEGFNHYSSSAHVQHGKMVETWLEHFPKARVVVRNFDSFIKKGGVVQDFVKNSGISFPSGLVDPGDFNPSIPSAFAEVGRRALVELPRNQALELVHNLIGGIKKVPHMPEADVEMFGTKNREILVEHYQDSLKIIRRLSQNDHFFDDPADFGRVRAVPELDASNDCLPRLKTYLLNSKLSDDAHAWIRGYSNLQE